MTTKAFNMDKLFEGSLQRLRTEADYFSRLTDHDPELGRLNETHLVNLLRTYLPPKFGIGTGFIQCGGAHARQSPQCDIVIYDALNNAPLYQSSAWSIYPIEMVYGVIEVKTTLNRAALAEAFEKCAAIRSMAKDGSNEANKSYLRLQPPPGEKAVSHFVSYTVGLAPRFFVFGYKGWSSVDTLLRNFRLLSDQYPKAHIHGVCNLTEEESLFIQHEAFVPGSSPALDRGGFRHFLSMMPLALEGMLPPDRNGMGFDLTNAGHYIRKREPKTL